MPASTSVAITCGRRKSRSEEHTSELQSLRHLVCRLLLEKKKKRFVLQALSQLVFARLPVMNWMVRNCWCYENVPGGHALLSELVVQQRSEFVAGALDEHW